MDDFAFPHFELYLNKHFKWQNKPVGPQVFHNINSVRNKKYDIWRAFLINENGFLQSDSFRKTDMLNEQF